MARYTKCYARVQQAAGRRLSDAEMERVFERIHQAALAINRGDQPTLQMARVTKNNPADLQFAVWKIAEEAAAQLKADALQQKYTRELQLLKISARAADLNAQMKSGLTGLESVKNLLGRDYSGRSNVASVEVLKTGHRDNFLRKILPVWESLGDDFLGFVQDPLKMRSLITEMRGEDSGNALAKKAAKAWHDAAEEYRTLYNEAGGQIGKLDNYIPQHHGRDLVATAGKSTNPMENMKAWVDYVMPLLDRSVYMDDAGVAFDDARMRQFLEKAWENIVTDGLANLEPGARGTPGVAGRHSEHRQIHFKSADAFMDYWQRFSDRSFLETIFSHIDRLAGDLSLAQQFGPNWEMTYRTLRDMAAKADAKNRIDQVPRIERDMKRLDNLWNVATGKTNPIANPNVSKVFESLRNLNVAGKLGGAVWASFFGDRAVFEAVSHLNNLPPMQRWQQMLRMIDPTNAEGREALMAPAIMVEIVR